MKRLFLIPVLAIASLFFTAPASAASHVACKVVPGPASLLVKVTGENVGTAPYVLHIATPTGTSTVSTPAKGTWYYETVINGQVGSYRVHVLHNGFVVAYCGAWLSY